VALAVCLLFDDRTDRALRSLWARLELLGVRTLLSHTHGRHVPHLTLASLLSYDLDAVRAALTELPRREPTDLHRHYRPGLWVPHCTVAPRLRLEQLATVAATVYDVLPLEAVAERAALVDSGTGERWPLPHCP
jgi:2'-5' RNA ligase